MRRFKYVLLAGLVVLALGIAGFALMRANSVPAEVGEAVAPVPSVTPTPTATTPAPALIKFGAGTRTLFFGDSWTFGMSAEPVTQGFAYLTAQQLKLDATVKGGPGTGYLNPGTTKQGTYADRLSMLPDDLSPALVVVQGSINDGNLSAGALPDAVDKFIHQLKDKFPAAQVVMVGPAPNAIPMDPSVTRLDNYLGQVAANNSLNYISPVKGKWITAENVSAIIDAKTMHPTNAGHAILASKTVDALNAIKAK